MRTFGLSLCVGLSLSNGLLRAQPPGPIVPAVPATISAPLPNDKMGVTIDRLSNGLTVYMSPNHLEPRVAAWIVVRAGSANDPPDSTGMAHYLEHMMFKGSPRLGALDFEKEKPHLDKITELYDEHFRTTDPKERERIYKEIDRENIEASKYEAPNEIDKLYSSLGFEGVNAFTAKERTAFVCNFPANRAEAWARLESDRFAHPVFRLFETELEAVYEEKNRSMDNADNILEEALDKALYKDHPYGHTVLGSIEHLKNPSLSKMYGFFDDYYRPGNMAIVLSGNFDRVEMLSLLEKTFGSWKPRPLTASPMTVVPGHHGVERTEVAYESEEEAVITWPTAPFRDSDRIPLTVMDMVVDNAQAGILNLTLNQAQKVKSSGSYPAFANQAGAWSLWAVPKKGQTLEEAEALLMGVLARLKAGDFSEEDLRAILTNFEVEEKEKLESNWSRTGDMAESFIRNEEWRDRVDWLNRIRQVTKADVLRVANKYLGPDRVVAYRREGKPVIPSIQKPGFTEVPIDPRRQSQFFKELEHLPTKPLEPHWLAEGKDYAVRAYSWGKLYATTNPVNDLFSVTFEFDRGRRQERDLCEALNLLNLSGAGSMSAEAYKKTLYALGSTMSVGCGEKASSVSMSGLESNYDRSMDLLFERFDAPNIAADTLSKMIDVEIGAHRDTKKEPGSIANALKEYAMRGKDSAVLNELSDEELRALDAEKLRDLVRHVFDYEHEALYVGVRASEAAAARFDAGRASFKPDPPYQPMTYLASEKPRVLLANREMVQSRVALFSPDGPVDPLRAVDDDYYDAYMGGSMGGVIFQEVRESRALAYSAGGGYWMGTRKRDQNLLWGAAGCEADKTVETAGLMRDLLLHMPVSEERFAEARKAVEEQYRGEVVNFRSIPGEILYWDKLGIGPKDPRPERFERALRYALDDLKRFAGGFESKKMAFYILGNRSRLDLDGLKKLGVFEEISLNQIFPY